VAGDIAWGGNWFFLVREHSQQLSLNNVEQLTNFTWAIRQALNQHGITGAGNQEIDHVELFASSNQPSVDSKNFVLCPGKAYDRSPCGTGTSAKLACLYADGKISEGQVWRQESIVGSVFEGTVSFRDGKIYPSIRGSAFVNAEAELVFDPRDPFRLGIRS
jgi:4-hydroxyproline epimerase